MKTFEIKNGDLVIGPGGYATVSGPVKVRQDLSIAVREPLGCDRFHPRWGSLLADFIGETIDDLTRMRVISEVNRVIANYMAVQQDLLTKATSAGRRPTFSSGEAVSGVQDVQVRQTLDRLHVKVILRTLSGQDVSLFSTVEG